MSLSLKNNRKQNDNFLTLTFLKEMSKKKENEPKEETVNLDSNSSEIAEIISKKLLDKVQKQIVLK